MNASEARAKTKQYAPTTAQELEIIYRGINLACEAGLYHYLWIVANDRPPRSVVDDVVFILKNEGYKIQGFNALTWMEIIW